MNSIVITSSENNFKALKGFVSRRGFRAISFPTIGIAPLEFSVPEKKYDWIVFTSRNAVSLFTRRTGPGFFKSKKIAAIGPRTARALAAARLKPDFVHDEPGSDGFVEGLSRRFPVKSKKFLLPVSTGARRVIQKDLSRLGGVVDRLRIYKTVPRISPEAVRDLLSGKPYGCIFFSSPSAFLNFVKIKELKKLLSSASTASIGPATAAVMKKRGVKPDVTGEGSSFRAALEDIMRYLESGA